MSTVLRFTVAGTLLLSACTRIEFEIIEVEGAGAKAASAVVELCGRSTVMEHMGNSLRASVRINCEGSGHIRVRIGDRQVTCRVGYVTSGMDARHWRYRINGDRCEAL